MNFKNIYLFLYLMFNLLKTKKIIKLLYIITRYILIKKNLIYQRCNNNIDK